VGKEGVREVGSVGWGTWKGVSLGGMADPWTLPPTGDFLIPSSVPLETLSLPPLFTANEKKTTKLDKKRKQKKRRQFRTVLISDGSRPSTKDLQVFKTGLHIAELNNNQISLGGYNFFPLLCKIMSYF
jgi:hypothetical protein